MDLQASNLTKLRGTVTEIKSSAIIIVCVNENSGESRVIDVNFFPFVPHIGDLVSIKTIKVKSKIDVEIKPALVEECTGKILKIDVKNGYGIIEPKIAFDLKRTPSQNQLRVGDTVKGTTVKGKL